MDKLVALWHVILSQPSWSWSIFAIAYFLFFLTLRHLFMHGLIRRAKALNSKWYGEIKHLYIKRWHFVMGWILFLTSLLIFIFLWQTANFDKPSLYEVGMIFIIILMTLFSIISHLIAFAVSLILIMKQIENNQMTL